MIPPLVVSLTMPKMAIMASVRERKLNAKGKTSKTSNNMPRPKSSKKKVDNKTGRDQLPSGFPAILQKKSFAKGNNHRGFCSELHSMIISGRGGPIHLRWEDACAASVV